MDEQQEQESRTRILGRMLHQYIGKDVIIAGKLAKVSANGDCVEVVTFDNIKINVSLPNPFQGNAEGILEVWGIVKSKGTVQAVTYVHFDEEGSKDFDGKSYNDLIVVQHAIQDNRWVLDEGQAAL